MNRVFSAGLAIFCTLASPLFSQSQLSVALLSGEIELSDIDAQIAAHADRPGVAFDLLALKAEHLSETGASVDAAETYVIMAALAVRFPDAIQDDVPSLLEDAAGHFLDAGDITRALEQFYALADALRDRAARPSVLGAVLREIAALEEAQGKPDVAQQLRDRADALVAPGPTPPATRSNDPGFANVDVFFATDRAKTGRTRAARFFGHDRDTGLNYGIAQVTIPHTHQPGTLSTPTVWRLEFAEDPSKHVMLQSVVEQDVGTFFSSMRDTLAAKGASDAFIFVHGYNVSFDVAAKRTAQMAFDMNFKGAPILYSWPSRGTTTGYISDTAVVRLSGRRLTLFLEDVLARSGARTVHIIAHSMGNRAVTDALELMALRRAPVEAPVFDQIIFAAPDVDQGLFEAMVPTIRPLARRLTLYASQQDRALEASRKLHGSAPRAGQGGDDALNHPEIDAIDMSELGDDMLAHSYVSNDQSAILDISTLFWLNPDPDTRCGLVKRNGARSVWDHKDDTCANQSLLNIISSLRNARAYSRSDVQSTLDQTFPNAPDLEPHTQFLFGLVETE